MSYKLRGKGEKFSVIDTITENKTASAVGRKKSGSGLTAIWTSKQPLLQGVQARLFSYRRSHPIHDCDRTYTYPVLLFRAYFFFSFLARTLRSAHRYFNGSIHTDITRKLTETIVVVALGIQVRPHVSVLAQKTTYIPSFPAKSGIISIEVLLTPCNSGCAHSHTSIKLHSSVSFSVTRTQELTEFCFTKLFLDGPILSRICHRPYFDNNNRMERRHGLSEAGFEF